MINVSIKNLWRLLFILSVTSFTTMVHGESVQVTAHWLGGSGNWNDMTKWSTDPAYPNNGTPSDVTYFSVLDAATSSTITLNSNVVVDDLLLDSASSLLQINTGGVLSVLDKLELRNGTLQLNGGTIKDTTIVSTGGTFMMPDKGHYSSTFDNVVLDTDLSIGGYGAYSNSIYIKNGLTIAAGRSVHFLTSNLTPSNAQFYFQGNQTLGGGGKIVFDAAYPSESSLFVPTDNTLTLAADATVCTGLQGGSINGASLASTLVNTGLISGETTRQEASRTYANILQIKSIAVQNQGIIQAINGGSVTIDQCSLDNQGLILAGSGSSVSITSSWVNHGTLRVSGGTLDLGGTFTPENIGNLDYQGGSVRVIGTLNNTGTFTVDNSTGSIILALGGKIVGGTIAAADGKSLVVEKGVLDGVTLAADMQLDSFAAGALLTVNNGLILENNTVSLQGYNGASGGWGNKVTFTGNAILGGTGTIRCAALKDSLIASQGGTLTIGPGISLNLNSALFLGDDSSGLVNQAHLKTGSSLLSITGSYWVNQGIIEVEAGGHLNLSGTVNTVDLGTIINPSANLTTLSAMVNNTGQIFDLNATIGPFGLKGTIQGGTLVGDSPARLYAGSGGCLDGVTIDTDVLMGNTANLAIKNRLILNNHNMTLTTGTSLNFLSSSTLEGSGTITVDSLPNSSGAQTKITGTGLVIGPDSSIRTGADNGGSFAVIFGGDNSINRGSFIVDKGTGAVIGANWQNQGTVQISGSGLLYLGGTFTPAAIGNFVHTGGTVVLNGTVTNAGATLLLDASKGDWYMRLAAVGGTTSTGTIVGGTVATAEGAQLFVDAHSDGILDGVNLAGNVKVLPYGELQIKNNLVLTNGTLSLEASSSPTVLRLVNPQKITGQGEIVVDGLGNGNNIIFSDLTIGPQVILRTGSGGGQVGLTNQLYSLANQGILSAQTPSQQLAILVKTFSNTGVLEAKNGGTLLVSCPSWTNQGTMRLNGGTIQTSGSTVTNGVGSCIEGSGTLNVSGDSFTNGGILAPGDLLPIRAVGLLSITGNYSQSSSGKITVDVLGPDTAGYDQLSISGTAMLSGNLELELLPSAHFTSGDTFRILSATSLVGQFDQILQPMYNGSPLFSVSYSSTNVTITALQSVPEPTTIMMLAACFLTGVCSLRRHGSRQQK